MITNPFHDTGTFLYPLKISENLRFSDIFRKYRKRPVTQNELILRLFVKVSANSFATNQSIDENFAEYTLQSTAWLFKVQAIFKFWITVAIYHEDVSKIRF